MARFLEYTPSALSLGTSLNYWMAGASLTLRPPQFLWMAGFLEFAPSAVTWHLSKTSEWQGSFKSAPSAVSLGTSSLSRSTELQGSPRLCALRNFSGWQGYLSLRPPQLLGNSLELLDGRVPSSLRPPQFHSVLLQFLDSKKY